MNAQQRCLGRELVVLRRPVESGRRPGLSDQTLRLNGALGRMARKDPTSVRQLARPLVEGIFGFMNVCPSFADAVKKGRELRR